MGTVDSQNMEIRRPTLFLPLHFRKLIQQKKKNSSFLSLQDCKSGAALLFPRHWRIVFSGTRHNRMTGKLWRASCHNVWHFLSKFNLPICKHLHKGRRCFKTISVSLIHMKGIPWDSQRTNCPHVLFFQPWSKQNIKCKNRSLILCHPMKILASLLSLPVKAKHPDGFVVQKLKVNSQNCVRRKVKAF